MASVEKYSSNQAVVNIIRHNAREIADSSNPDIDRTRSGDNESLLPPRDVSDYQYFKDRLSEVRVFNRADVVKLAGWIITCPADCPPEREGEFFALAHQFMNERYGEENCVQSVIHRDEAGRSHLHYLTIPIVPDRKHGGEKLCAKEVLTRKELRNFHPALQKYLYDHDMPVTVHSGITREQGGNKTVRQLKQETREREVEKQWEREKNIERTDLIRL